MDPGSPPTPLETTFKGLPAQNSCSDCVIEGAAPVNFELPSGCVEMLRWEFASCSGVFQSLYDGTDVELFKCADERDIQGVETSAREACRGV